MNNKINEIVSAFKDKYKENSSIYSDEQLMEIAANCVSLSETWFDSVKGLKGLSFELVLYNKDNVQCETLHGVNADVLPSTMLDILVNKNSSYSKMCLNYFTYNHGVRNVVSIGELEIS